MTTDPICGMRVDDASALRAERDGQVFYFCGEHCRRNFLSAPATTKHGEEPHGCCQPSPPAHDHGNSSATRVAAPYFCPMCPGAESQKPGDCPKCDMALERNPARVAPAVSQPLYICPMHPEAKQDHPGNCPKCSMALEPRTVTVGTVEEEYAELHDMSKRSWIGVALILPVLVLAMAHMVPALGRQPRVESHVARWIQFALPTPVVGWAGWPFFHRGWRSVVTRHLNMFTLIAIGVGAAFVFSAVAMHVFDLFPSTMQHEGNVAIYFEAAAVIIVSVLFGQVLELRARSRTGSAIKALLNAAPPTARLVAQGGDREVPLDQVEPHGFTAVASCVDG